MDFADVLSGDKQSSAKIDAGFGGGVVDRDHPWDQSAADGGGVVHLLVLWFETAAAFTGSDRFLSLVLRRRLGERLGLSSGHPGDDSLKVLRVHRTCFRY